MKGTTHLAVGLAAVALIPEPTIINASALVIGAILPDMDKSTSLIGRHIPIIPKLLPHRTITHGLLFALLLSAMNVYLGLGCVIHLTLDACNPEGIPLFWPVWTRRQRIPGICKIVRSGGWIDRALGYAMWLFVLCYYSMAIMQGAFPPDLARGLVP